MARRKRTLSEIKFDLEGRLPPKGVEAPAATETVAAEPESPAAPEPAPKSTPEPIPPAVDEEPPHGEGRAQGLSEHRIKVLLVDDQNMIGEAVRRMLADEKDISFEHCQDPTQAIAVANRFGPTTILQDLVMPLVDGLTLVKYFRVNPLTRSVPLIVLSTKEEPAIKAEAFALGANDYMVKLPDRLEVLARIRYHSRAYISQLQRDEAYAALQRSQRQLELRNRFVREVFGRYLSDDVVESILESPDALKIGGELRTVTIMMADLRGFTALSERLRPEQIVSLLNNYLGAMTDIIFRYHGTIDEFLGDAILAMFGAPIFREGDAERAVACAVEMQQAMREVNERNRNMGLPDVEMGIGLNTGEVVVGNIGSQRRTKYGLVGPPVNLASRIESYTTGGQILISETTRKAAGPAVNVTGQLEVLPKGVPAPITLHEVGGIGDLRIRRSEEAAEPLLAIPDPVGARYVVIEGKHVSGEHHDGTMIALSHTEARIGGPIDHLDLLANLTMRLVDASGRDVAQDIYAKVVEMCPEGPAFRIRFTSTPPPARCFLDSLRKAARDKASAP